MLVIRFFPVGKKNQPSYKIVVTDKKRAASRGRFVEEIGFYNPLTKEKNLKVERIKYWLSVGAQPSDTIHNMLVRDKIIEGKARDVHKKAKKKEESAEAVPAPKVATPEPAAVDKVEEKPAEEKKEEPKDEETSALAASEEKKEEAPKEDKVEEQKEEKPKEAPKEEKTT